MGHARTASARSPAHALPGFAARAVLIRHNRTVSARARTTRPGQWMTVEDALTSGVKKRITAPVRTMRLRRVSPERRPVPPHAEPAAPSPMTTAVRLPHKQTVCNLLATHYFRSQVLRQPLQVMISGAVCSQGTTRVQAVRPVTTVSVNSPVALPIQHRTEGSAAMTTRPGRPTC